MTSSVGVDALSADEREEAKERREAEIEFVQSAYGLDEAYISDEGRIVRLLNLPIACGDLKDTEGIPNKGIANG